MKESTKHAAATISGITKEDRAMIDALAYDLFLELADEIEPGSKEDENENEAARQFAKINGLPETSPLVMFFKGFRAGLGKGIDLAMRIESLSE